MLHPLPFAMMKPRSPQSFCALHLFDREDVYHAIFSNALSQVLFNLGVFTEGLLRPDLTKLMSANDGLDQKSLSAHGGGCGELATGRPFLINLRNRALLFDKLTRLLMLYRK